MTTFLIFAGCKKAEILTTVKGEVKNSKSGEPLANIPIRIIEYERCFFCFGSPEIPLESTRIFTDGKGRFNYSFEAAEKNYYKIGVDPTDQTTGSYGMRMVDKNKLNTYSFSESLLKVLQLRISVLRHDKNQIVIYGSNQSADPSWSREFYRGPNPTVSLDATIFATIPEGRKYALFAYYFNQMANEPVSDAETITTVITVGNADTTKAEFIIR